MRFLPVLLAFGVAVLLISASVYAQDAGTPKPLTLQLKTPTADKVAAVVNGEKIMDSEITRIIERQLQGRPLPPERMQQVHQQLLDAFIDQHLVSQFIAKQNLKIDPKEVDKAIEEIKQEIAASKMSFDEIMKAEGLTEATLRQQIASQLMTQKYVDQAVTEQDIKAYYEAHKAEAGGEEVRASHILVQVPDNATPADKQAALAKIKSVQGELAKGLDFAEAAKKYSDCPSKEEGGDLSYFPRKGKMVEPFAEAAFALKIGEVSQPVETQFGWHLIKCTERRAKPAKSLAELHDQIKSVLGRDLMEKLAESQRKTAKIELPK